MSDLIDRQAAVDAIEQMQMPIMRSEFLEEQFVFTGMSEALQAIKELPPVQPEPLTIRVNRELTKEEYDKLMQDIKDAPIVLLPSAQPERKTSEWLHEYLQTAVDFGIITETQASRLMDMIAEDNA